MTQNIQNNKVIDSYRPIPFYFINTTKPSALTKNAIFKSMAKLKNAGFGGCIVFNKPPDGFTQENYLEEKWFKLIEHFAEAGRNFKLQIWLNDGFDFPPGDAGGRIQKVNPSLKQRMFVLNAAGKIEVKEIDWGFPAFEEPESSELFIELVYEKYKKHLGKYFGNGITGFFSDADCRRFGPIAGKELQDMKNYFPCSKNFFNILKKEYGYDLETVLPDIMLGKKCSQAEDYWSLAGKLYAQWFRNNYNWCQGNGLKYTFHSSDTGPFSLNDCKRSSIFTEGRYLHLAQFCDFPGTDHELLSLNGGKHFSGQYFIPEATWGGGNQHIRDKNFYDTNKDVRAKYASSAAFIYDKKRVLCEAFAATNWGVDFDELRKIASWQIMQGVNFFVPHAVHHRLHGDTKFFAPPDFSEAGQLHCGIKEFNDWLAEICMYASMGKLIAPIAILDPTQHIWQGESDGGVFFDICSRLNNMPFGYVIVDKETIIDKKNDFKVLVNPGLQIEQSLIDAFNRSGGIIIEYDKIHMLSEIIGNDISFDGTCKLQYMRRRLDSGEEILLVANNDNKKTVSGEINFKGKEFKLELYPGEIMVLEEDREIAGKPLVSPNTIPLTDKYDVFWEKENMLPLSRWENSNGIVKTMNSFEDKLIFTWVNQEEIETPYILVPEKFLDHEIIFNLDGQRITVKEKFVLFADRYIRYRLDNARCPGIHTIELIKKNPSIELPRYNNIYLSGDFSVNIDSSEDFACLNHEYYSMKLYLPSKVKVFLGKRPEKLKIGSWTDQGHPFYSGSTTYCKNLNVPENFKDGYLVLPSVKSVCSVKINGINIGKRIWQPYKFRLPGISGKCYIEITVWNTLANMLEEYRAESGILKNPFIEECRKGA